MQAVLDANSIGPVDVAVIRFDGNEFSGDVAPALAELDRSGTVHIIDLAFLRRPPEPVHERIRSRYSLDAWISDVFGLTGITC